MSYEYFAQVGPDGMGSLALREIVASAQLQSMVTVLASADDRISLRWSGQPVRPEWREDMTVIPADRGITVQFHTGSTQQCRQFLRALSDLVQSLGASPLEFEEL